jgi:predicted kinase
LNVAVIIIDCIASANTLATRLQHRTQHANDASEADIEIMQKQLIAAEAFNANEIQYVVAIDTEQPFDGAPIAQQLQQTAA